MLSARCCYCPGQLAELGRSAVAALLLIPNLYFWLDLPGGYFGVAKRLPPPMLHTWSLGVEEQFYRLFPAFLFVCARFRITQIAIIAVIAIFVTLWIIGITRAPEAAFSLPPTRARELALGAALALDVVALSQRWQGAIAIIGLTLLGFAFVLPDDKGEFPMRAVACAAIGTSLLIESGPETAIGRLLALEPLRGIGRISYSLYLWHWPVILFARQWLVGDALPVRWALATIAGSIALAWLTWHFVKNPARQSIVPFRRVLAGVAMGCAVALTGASLIIASAGWPGRFDPQVLTMSAQESGDQAPLAKVCENGPLDQLESSCLIGSGTPDLAIWGDSHAAADSAGIAAAFGQSTVVAMASGCAPSLSATGSLPGSIGHDACAQRNRAVLRWLNERPAIATVVLVARWPAYAEMTGSRHWRGVQAAVMALKGKRVLIIAGTPEPGVNVPWANALRRHLHRPPLSLTCPRAKVAVRDVLVVDLSAAFCAHPRPWRLFVDSSHPSLTANNEVIAPTLRQALLDAP